MYAMQPATVTLGKLAVAGEAGVVNYIGTTRISWSGQIL